MKSELMEKLYALKEVSQKNTEKINAIRQDRNLSEEGKNAAITPLVEGIKQAAKETRNKLAYMRGQCIGDVGAAVAARSNMLDGGNYAKSAYFFQRMQALPEDVRGFSPAWSAFKQSGDGGGQAAPGPDGERRRFYVGLTRARDRLFVSHAAKRDLFGRMVMLKASRFLGELDLSGVKRSALVARKVSQEKQLGLLAP